MQEERRQRRGIAGMKLGQPRQPVPRRLARERRSARVVSAARAISSSNRDRGSPATPSKAPRKSRRPPRPSLHEPRRRLRHAGDAGLGEATLDLDRLEQPAQQPQRLERDDQLGLGAVVRVVSRLDRDPGAALTREARRRAIAIGVDLERERLFDGEDLEQER